jgi:hypothetical protein
LGAIVAVTAVERITPRWANISLATVALALAVSGPIPHSGVIPPRDVAFEQLAVAVEQHLTRIGITQPMIAVAPHDAWPTAVGLVLYLTKHRVPVYADRELLSIVGRQFQAPRQSPRAVLIVEPWHPSVDPSRSDLRVVAANSAGSVLLRTE